MLRFESDYLEGAHPAVLKKLTETNFEQCPGYSEDLHCENARKLIQSECGIDASVHFLVGGTQANTTIIASILKAHQGVLAADTGHIAVHETGAIEATGHKVLTLPHTNGKISAAQVEAYVSAHYADSAFEHTVQPGMVYISHPTEYGTLYTKEELTALSNVCRKLGLPLFLDGARLGYGLMSDASDMTIKDIAQLCDVFYIGGTKVGALFGEAVVITAPAVAKDFRYHIKQHGGMLAKGRLLGIQFEALLETGVYWQISKYADNLAKRIKDAFVANGFTMAFDSPTNQQFIIVSEDYLKKVQEKFSCSLFERRANGDCVIRFCTSWATQESAVDELIAFINANPAV